ncbi:cobalamin-independent methionine synthase II family protein [Vreelandella sp. EE22]
MNVPLAPFRADVVGSLLRPTTIKDARLAHQKGQLDARELRQIEDEAIQAAVQQQCQCGLHVVTDGEFRRAWWHFDFFEGLEGVEGYDAKQGIQFTGVQTKSRNVKVTGKLGFGEHPMLEDFKYLASIAQGAAAKMTIPSPSVLHFRGGRDVVSKDVYPNIDDFFDDLAKVYRQAIKAFYDAGCRYLQLDDTVWAYLCSDAQRALVVERGEDPDHLAQVYARVINQALEGKPDDLVVGMHVCRGNFRSTWISEGGYEPVAELLFGSVNIDAFFLEYDSDRAGDFKPLRFIKPGHQKAVLGLVTTKTGELEDPEEIKARIFEAARHMPLEQICLSTQCGFASTEEGNSLTPAQQQAKLELVVQVARDVWGE